MADKSIWNLDSLKAHIDELRIADAKALELQHAEYSRRLEDLNHARAEAQERDGEFVRQEIYDQRHEDLVRRMSGAERVLANFQGRIAAGALVLAVAVALVTAFISHIAFG